MAEALRSSEKYSVIEIALCGQDLRPAEKEAARALLLRSRIPGGGTAAAAGKHGGEA